MPSNLPGRDIGTLSGVIVPKKVHLLIGSPPPILLRLPLHRWRIRVLVVSTGPSVGPKAKGNGSPDRERDHGCVPQSHGVTDGLFFFSQRSAI